jgi:hypothetical protein
MKLKIKVFNKENQFLGNLYKITETHIIVRHSFGSQGYQFDVRVENVIFLKDKIIVNK